MKNSDMPAAPIFNENGYPQVARVTLDNNEPQCSGLTKREHFAGLAMQAMLSNPNVIGFSQSCGWDLVNCSKEQLSQTCINHADALLAELEKSE